MKKQRRRWVEFKFHITIEQLCKPNEVKRAHDKLHRETAQALADYLGTPLTLTDCKTGRFKGSVRPRR